MEESFLPWWLMFLLGMWAVALALWQSPSIHREVRLWSGLATLVYLALIFHSVPSGARATGTQSSPAMADTFTTIASIGCMALSLLASVWVLSQASRTSRRLSYSILTVSNAGFCASVGEPELAIALMIVAGISVMPLSELRSAILSAKSFRDRIANVLQFDPQPIQSEDAGRFWLTCGINGVLAFVIIGTVAYSLRVEATRTGQSPRHTALPSPKQVERHADDSHHAVGKPTIMEFALGERADVVVLMAVLLFLVLAIVMNDSTAVKMVSSFSDTEEKPEFAAQEPG